jgi:hypothetical protein
VGYFTNPFGHFRNAMLFNAKPGKHGRGHRAGGDQRLCRLQIERIRFQNSRSCRFDGVRTGEEDFVPILAGKPGEGPRRGPGALN